MTATALRASVVRINARMLLIPHGQQIPERSVVLGKATPDAVYQTFYEATHCRRGHRRLRGPGSPCRYKNFCANPRGGGRIDHGPEWTWGAPA